MLVSEQHTPNGVNFPCLYATAHIAHVSSIKQPAADPIRLEIIKSLPAEIDGCTQLLASNKDSFKKEEYLFVGNLQDVGFIRSNGKLIKLKSRSQNVYYGSGYQVVIKTKEKRIGDEVYSSIGTMVIQRGKMKKTVAVVGELGC